MGLRHLKRVRDGGRVMTQIGMYSQTQPRNDISVARGQWGLDNAYRYVSEASGGYHIRTEYNHRASNVPYWSGKGGITPPGGNTGPLGSFVPGFTPDLRKEEKRYTMAILVKF